MKGDELEMILDDALASYSRYEPRPGLEARVMARVRAESNVPRGRWLGVAAVAACVAITFMNWPRETHQHSAVPVEPVVSLPKQEAPHPAPSQFTKPSRHKSFPSTAALTAEERALIAFVQQAPEVAAQLTQPDKPLEIEAINIQPIQIDGLEIGEMK